MATSTIPNTVNNKIASLTGNDIPVSYTISDSITTYIGKRINNEAPSNVQRKIVSISYNWTSALELHIRFVTADGTVWKCSCAQM